MKHEYYGVRLGKGSRAHSKITRGMRPITLERLLRILENLNTAKRKKAKKNG